MKPKINIKPIKEAPNLQELKDKFGVDEEDLVVAYGDAIYCPAKGLSRDLLVHEMVHCERQKMNPVSAERWWKMYIENEEFRLNEEAIAYSQQYKYCEKVFKDRNARSRILNALAEELSSGMYGKLCTLSEARKLIA